MAISMHDQGISWDLTERIAELELAQDDIGWTRIGDASQFEFSRSFVMTITRMARLYYLKNPLITRGVNVKADYVFGRPVAINAADDTINDVLQAFLDDEQNQTEFTSHIARIQKERELQTDGNIFFVLIPHPITGHIRIKSIDVDEIADKILDPYDRKRTLYYKRQWIEKVFNFDTGETKEETRIAYYKDWRNKDKDRTSIAGNPVIEGAYVYHVKVGGFSNWKFGISEFYAAQDWAKAYKTFLENWSTIVASYARFAWAVVTEGGKTGVAAAKTKLASTMTSTSGETNPAPAAGSVAIMDKTTSMSPYKTAGATTSAEDGRRLMLMVAAVFGFPETFFGDVSVGTLATAKSLDRPTELMLSNRQVLWADIYTDIFQFILYHATAAPQGLLRSVGSIVENEYNEQVLFFGDDVNPRIDITFPSIIEIDVAASIGAIVSASTFDGKQPSVIPDKKMLARMVLSVLGEDNIDETINTMYPEDYDPKLDQAIPQIPGQSPILDQQDPTLTAPIEALRESIDQLRSLIGGTA